jgi:putative signal transducing protein
MRVVLTSTDRTLIESARVALEADGITVALDGEAGSALPFIPVKLLVGDQDVAAAQELLRPLTSAEGIPPSRTSWHDRSGRLLVVVLLLLLLIVCGQILIG